MYLKDTAEMPSRIFTGGSNGLMAYSYGDMRLTVKGYDHHIYTGLVELERRPGYQQFAQNGITQNLSLFGGGNWIEVQKTGLPYRFVTTPYMKNATIGLAEDLQLKHDYFSSWLPSFRSGIDTILFLGQGSNLSRQHDHIVLSIQDRYNPANLAGEWMNNILFGSQASLGYGYENPERDVRGKISSLFWYLYYIEEKGLSDRQLRSAYMNLRSVQELLFKNGSGTDPQNKIGITMATKVRRALLEGKGDQVKQILTHFYQQGLMLPSTNSNPLRPLEEPISYSQWEREWERVMNDQ
ncbi:hypothetical protein [Peribacillus sp. NPDC056705]|uniref:hypothetical protein n=1 Tax=Peribacillus sp. NPDC056705 TaxID=3345918 RepID=UPI003749BBE2